MFSISVCFGFDFASTCSSIVFNLHRNIVETWFFCVLAIQKYRKLIDAHTFSFCFLSARNSDSLIMDIQLGLVICNWTVLLSILITIWCTFDAAGRSWVKMKKYQRSMRESESRFNYKRSGSMNRNWRQR